MNFYPVPLHTDSDAYLESWTIRALRSLFAKSEGSVESLDARPRRAAPHESNSGATVLPLRGLALFTRPDRDITHAFFQREEHGAWDGGRARAPPLRVGAAPSTARPAPFICSRAAARAGGDGQKALGEAEPCGPRS